MNTLELMRAERESFPVSELRKMFGIRKTDTYWLLQHREIKTVRIGGHLRIVKASFWEWYENQTRYKLIDGPAPGQRLRKISYSAEELAAFLHVHPNAVYMLLKRGAFDTFTVDYCTRITKESFERWYAGQEWYRKPEDRLLDKQRRQGTYTLTDIRKMLGVHRNTFYNING